MLEDDDDRDDDSGDETRFEEEDGTEGEELSDEANDEDDGNDKELSLLLTELACEDETAYLSFGCLALPSIDEAVNPLDIVYPCIELSISISIPMRVTTDSAKKIFVLILNKSSLIIPRTRLKEIFS